MRFVVSTQIASALTKKICSFSWDLAKNAAPRHALNSTDMTGNHVYASVLELTQVLDPTRSLRMRGFGTLLQSNAFDALRMVDALGEDVSNAKL